MKVLVTGAGAGLGRATVEHAIAKGATVVALDQDAGALAELEWLHPRHVSTRTIDLADTAATEKLTRDLAAHFRFDLAVLAAGVSATGRFEAIPPEAYARLLRVNVSAPLVMAARLVGEGAMRKKSTIVFVSSLSHVTGYPGASVYAASKDAVAAYAEAVRRPFRRRGVHVCAVFPGPLRTEHAERHAPPGANPERRMDPARAAHLIWKHRKVPRLFPGMGARTAASLGRLAPETMTKVMRRVIFDKLDGEVW